MIGGSKLYQRGSGTKLAGGHGMQVGNLRSNMRWYSQRQWPWCSAWERFGNWVRKVGSKSLLSRRPRTWCKVSVGLETSSCSKVHLETLGQASVEAALMLPILMLLFAMLLQPACLLYTRAIMQQAAAETARALISRTTSGAFSDESYVAYARRRLSAVPNVAAFHTGGESGWQIELSGSESSSEVSVSIKGKLRPLPFVGVVATMLGEVEGDEVVLSVEAQEAARPSWLEGSYKSWAAEWD